MSDHQETGIARQILCVQDRVKMKEAIDELGDDGIAVLILNKREDDDGCLRIILYGEGRQTEFLGLLGYGSVVMHRTYFTSEDDE